MQAALTPAALRARGLGRLGLALIALALLGAWLSRPPASEAEPRAALHRVLVPVEAGAAVALVAAPGGDVWWVTRERAVRFAADSPGLREVALDADLYRQHFGRHPRPLSAAHVDETGGLWLGAGGGEVLHRAGDGWREVATPLDGAGGRVRAIASDGERIFVAGRGLRCGALAGGGLEPCGPFDGARVERLAAHPALGLVAATSREVWRQDGGGWRRVWQVSDRGGRVRALAPGRDGELWIGTHAGLVRVAPDGRVRRELRGVRVESLVAEGPSGAAFVGGAGLFVRYAGGWRRVDAADGAGLRSVRGLAAGPRGRLWLALGRQGLFRAGG